MSFDVTEVIVDEDTTPGDVKFLQQINELGKEKRKLLGLYAPEKKDAGVQTAVQFNIVGEGAGGEITSMMQEITKGAPVAAPEARKQPAIEDAQVVEDQAQEQNSSEVDIDKLMEELLIE